ncbi:hypothetical protein KC345_g4839 [Hortaea werneckii]|nr:hypothetical protein KC345_g4839 [Hortaea werneckii]
MNSRPPATTRPNEGPSAGPSTDPGARDTFLMPPPPRPGATQIPAAAAPSFPGGRDILIGSAAGAMDFGHPPTDPLGRDEYLGQYRSPPVLGTLHGAPDVDFQPRPALLTEPLPGGHIPNARTTLPRHRRETTFPGNNPTMPEGAVGYVGRDEAVRWGHLGGPSMYPAEAMGPEEMAMREADPRYSPPGSFPDIRTAYRGLPSSEIDRRGGVLGLEDLM